MIKKILFLLFGATLMMLLVLAIGGVHLLPEYVLGSLMQSGVWQGVGEIFGLMLLPGLVVGYAACQHKVVGIIAYALFLTCGVIGGFNLWWVATAVLMVASYFVCVEPCLQNPKPEAYQQLGCYVPALGALQIIGKYGLDKTANVIGKIIGAVMMVAAVLLPYLQAFADTNIESGSMLGEWMRETPAAMAFIDFGNTLSGVMLYYVFLPLNAVICAKYLFDMPKLAKIIGYVMGGYNAYRGTFIVMPILTSATSGGASSQVKSGHPLFDNLFGVEACFMVAMLLGGILCILIARGKGEKLLSGFCQPQTGCPAIGCLFVAILVTLAVYAIAPCIISVAWIVVALVFLMLSTVAINMMPKSKGFDWGYYNMLRSHGLSESDAFAQAQMRSQR